MKEMAVDNARLNFSFRSKKLAKGVKSNANKNAKNRGARIDCPILMRKPKIRILTKTKDDLNTKGSFISFIFVICFKSRKKHWKQKNPFKILKGF